MTEKRKCTECGLVTIIYRSANICDDCANRRETRRAEDARRDESYSTDFYTAINPIFDNTIAPSYDPPAYDPPAYDPPSTFDGFGGSDSGFSGGGSSGEF